MFSQHSSSLCMVPLIPNIIIIKATFFPLNTVSCVGHAEHVIQTGCVTLEMFACVSVMVGRGLPIKPREHRRCHALSNDDCLATTLMDKWRGDFFHLHCSRAVFYLDSKL